MLAHWFWHGDTLDTFSCGGALAGLLRKNGLTPGKSALNLFPAMYAPA